MSTYKEFTCDFWMFGELWRWTWRTDY